MSAEAQANLESPSVKHMRTAFEQATARSTVQQTAFDAFAKVGFPTPRDEHWKYTNLRRLESRQFAMGSQNAPLTSSPKTPSNAYQAVFVDGFFRSELSTLPNTKELRVISIAALQDSAPEQFTEALSIGLNNSGSMQHLNTALTQDGIVIEVAANTVVKNPLFLNFMWSKSSNNLMAHPRISIKAGSHSNLTVIQQYIGTGAHPNFNNSVTTIQLAEAAHLEHGLIQSENNQSFNLHLIQAELSAQATFKNHHFNFGGSLARTDINVLLKGTDTNVVLNGLQFASGNQHHDTHLRIDHCVPHTSSHQDYRGIADQRGRIVFNGKVKVHEQAAKTDAQQSSRNLLLSSTAEIDTKPELEIYNDDVKCAHGATVGQLDATALFYLRSRGLDEPQARALLTHAFANHIIRQVAIPELQQQLTDLCNARFSDQLETAT